MMVFTKRFRIGLMVVSLTLFVTALACSDLYTVPNIDPHPPSISNFVIEPSSIAPADDFVISFNYRDAGLDIVSLELEDNESNFKGTLKPPKETPDMVLFPELSGRATFDILGFTGSLVGKHTFRLRVQDVIETYSNVVTATVIVDPRLNPVNTVPPYPLPPEPPPPPPPTRR